jgi:hypothetical protein
MSTPPTIQTGGVEAGFAVVLQSISQAQTAMAVDVTATRTDMARVFVKLEAIDGARADLEARMRVMEQRPSTVELAADVKGLLKFRYTLAGAVVVGGAFAGWVGEWAAQHLH